MTQLDDHMIDLIKEAVDLEANAKRFYEHAATLTHNEDGKKMFLRLAKEEDGHMDEAGKLFTSILGNDDWKAIAEQEKKRHAKSSIVETFASAMHEWGSEALADDIEALRMAMDLERRAIQFFSDIAKKSNDPKVHKLAGKMADEERFHYDMLQAQHDSLLNVGIWFDDVEFRMDGKC